MNARPRRSRAAAALSHRFVRSVVVPFSLLVATLTQSAPSAAQEPRTFPFRIDLQDGTEGDLLRVWLTLLAPLPEPELCRGFTPQITGRGLRPASFVGDLLVIRPYATFVQNEAGVRASFDLRYIDDEVVEGDESFILHFTSDDECPFRRILPQEGNRVVVIRDNDPLAFTLDVGRAREGDRMEATVRLTRAVQRGVTVTPIYPGTGPLSGDAAEDGDFTPNQDPIVFVGLKDETATFEIQTVEDNIVENDEQLWIDLAPGGLDMAAFGTIENDDGPALLRIAGQRSSDPTVSEGQDLMFAASLFHMVEGGLTAVPSYADGTARVLSDYIRNQDPIRFEGTGAETLSFSVVTIDDAIDEPDGETFTVTMQVTESAVPREDIDATDSATATINDDDDPMISIMPSSVLEGERLEFVLTLNEAIQGGLTATPTYPRVGEASAAAPDLDYVPSTAPITFVGRAGEKHTVALPTVADDLDEMNDEETVALGLILNGPTFPTETTSSVVAVGAIRDRDRAAMIVEGDSAVEGEDLEFAVTLNLDTEGTVTVMPTYPGFARTDTAAPEFDYQRNVNPLTFSGDAGQKMTFSVSTVEDTVPELDETFTVGVAATASSFPVDVTDTATGTIRDDDAPLEATAQPAEEGEPLTVTMTLTQAVSGGVTVSPRFSSVDFNTATPMADYFPNVTPIIFDGLEGETRQLIVSTQEDAIDEPDVEFFAVELVATAGLFDRFVRNPVLRAQIVDDDQARIKIGGNPTEREGDVLNFDVSIVGAGVEGSFTLTPIYEDESATFDVDYAANRTPLEFDNPSVDDTKTLRVSSMEDMVAEEEETFSFGSV